MPINIPAAMACASLIFGIPVAHPDNALTILASQTVLDRLCQQAGSAETRSAGGCNAAYMVDGRGRELIVSRSTYIDWETQVAESCHILQYRNGLPKSESQCHHDVGWRQFYAERIKACTAKGITARTRPDALPPPAVASTAGAARPS
jgi:hypothetical protein